MGFVGNEFIRSASVRNEFIRSASVGNEFIRSASVGNACMRSEYISERINSFPTIGDVEGPVCQIKVGVKTTFVALLSGDNNVTGFGGGKKGVA